MEVAQGTITSMLSSVPTTPPTPPTPLEEISQRLMEGLQVDIIFPDSSYLEDTKAELKKVLKQK